MPRPQPAVITDRVLRGKFNKTVVRGIRDGNGCTTPEKVVTAYKGVTGLPAEDLTYPWGLSEALNTLYADLVRKDKTIDGIGEELQEKHEFTHLAGTIWHLIVQIDERKEYLSLPAEERKIMTDLLAFLRGNDIESARRKALELAPLIRARQDGLRRYKWAAVVGIALTVVFGLFAVYATFWIR